jgi:hypothetical protein
MYIDEKQHCRLLSMRQPHSNSFVNFLMRLAFILASTFFNAFNLSSGHICMIGHKRNCAKCRLHFNWFRKVEEWVVLFCVGRLVASFDFDFLILFMSSPVIKVVFLPCNNSYSIITLTHYCCNVKLCHESCWSFVFQHTFTFSTIENNIFIRFTVRVLLSNCKTLAHCTLYSVQCTIGWNDFNN